MSIAILAYDLKDVKSDDNARVKAALIQKYSNTFTHYNTQNVFSVVPEWVKLRFPDTTIFVENATAPAADAVKEIVDVIRSVGAEPGSIFFAYIGENFLWNAQGEAPRLQ